MDRVPWINSLSELADMLMNEANYKTQDQYHRSEGDLRESKLTPEKWEKCLKI